ncbi:MAG: hypothetical protein EP299_01705 [Acidobacteria bacterium]|nr:MAG: hypothetical protein EP299_01705 [Acidobacteriota bacterium]
MPERREDDHIDPVTGIPLSAAHQAIYEHLDDCKEELIEHHDKMLEEFEKKHIDDRHHPAMTDMFPGQTPEKIVRSLVDMSNDFNTLADTVLGTRRTPFEGGGRNDDGWDHKIEDLYAKLGNGQPVKIKLPPALWAAIISTVGLVIVEIIQHL